MTGAAMIKRGIASSLLGWICAAPAAGPWHYTIDEVREQQQANFCADRRDVESIVDVFTAHGARTGYAALSGSPGCEVAVRTFTPRRVVSAVTIAEGEPGEYTIRFVEVESDRGERIYLITTRDVVAE